MFLVLLFHLDHSEFLTIVHQTLLIISNQMPQMDSRVLEFVVNEQIESICGVL